MAYRYIDSEKIEQRRRKSTRTSGVISIVISLLFIACGIFFLVALESSVGMLVMLIFALLFIAGGIYFFNQIKIEEKRSLALDNPNSRAYQKKQQRLAKEREKYLRKAEHHGSLKSILCRRAAMIWGISMDCISAAFACWDYCIDSGYIGCSASDRFSVLTSGERL